LGQSGREQKRLQQKPFGDKAVKRRQARDGEWADQREPSHPRHPVDKAAELAEAPFLRRVQHRSRREEQQAFEKRVIEAMVKRSGKSDRRNQRLGMRFEKYREAAL